MERNYNDREFERYLKEHANQHRMFPSEKVWKNINKKLHYKRRWYGLGLTFLFVLIGGVVTWVMTAYPISKNSSNKPIANNKANQQQIITGRIDPTAAADIKEILSLSKPILPSSDQPGSLTNALNLSKNDIADQLRKEPVTALMADTRSDNTIRHAIRLTADKETQLTTAVPDLLVQPERSVILPQETAAPRQEDQSIVPLLTPEQEYSIENVVASYKAPKKRVSFQVFVTPTVSYRVLSENKSFENLSPLDPNASPNLPFTLPSDVSKAVTHKPDMGMQIGVIARYPLSKTIRLRAGFQFNINKYDILAIANSGEVATINLTGNGIDNGTLATWSRYRNQDGYRSDWLKNYYLSLSAPIGAEVKLFGNDKTSMGIAGTVQPTFIVSDRAYLLSSDYKNYAEVPWLIRRTNISTGFETFVNYTSKGGMKWQVGPQVRYQLLSSFQNKYPVKENLFDIGIKIGLTFND